MLVSELIIRCAKDFNDYDDDGASDDLKYTEVKVEDWVDFYNSALRQLVLVRPDSHVKTVSHQLTANSTRQSAPSDSLRIIDITRNMGSDGATPGASIRLADKETLDDFDASWHSDDGETAIEFFSYDVKMPDTFWVYPRVHATTAVYVEIDHSYMFTEVSLSGITTTDVEAKDVFIEPVKALMKSYAYDLDTDEQNANKSLKLEQSFYQMLGIEFKSGSSISAKRKATR